MSELKPCPFCGSGHVWPSKTTGSMWHFIYCSDCLAEGPAKAYETEAVESWNLRASESDGEKT